MRDLHGVDIRRATPNPIICQPCSSVDSLLAHHTPPSHPAMIRRLHLHLHLTTIQPMWNNTYEKSKIIELIEEEAGGFDKGLKAHEKCVWGEPHTRLNV